MLEICPSIVRSVKAGEAWREDAKRVSALAQPDSGLPNATANVAQSAYRYAQVKQTFPDGLVLQIDGKVPALHSEVTERPASAHGIEKRSVNRENGLG
jgi:hypothetical protein